MNKHLRSIAVSLAAIAQRLQLLLDVAYSIDARLYEQNAKLDKLTTFAVDEDMPSIRVLEYKS